MSQDRVRARFDLHSRSSGNSPRIIIATRVYIFEDTTARLYAPRRGANIIIDNPGKIHSSGNIASWQASSEREELIAKHRSQFGFPKPLARKFNESSGEITRGRFIKVGALPRFRSTATSFQSSIRYVSVLTAGLITARRYLTSRCARYRRKADAKIPFSPGDSSIAIRKRDARGTPTN